MRLLVYLICLFVIGLTFPAVLSNYFPLAYVEEGLPRYGDYSDKVPTFGAIVQLKREYRICSGVVIDKNYVLTAAHCVSDTFTHYEGDVEILDQHGFDTGVKTRVVGFLPKTDIALLLGDLSQFESLRIDPYNGPTFGALYLTCGFPALQNKVTCNKFVPYENYFFQFAGTGFLIGGMSGGPVIEPMSNTVIGVNSAVYGNKVIVSPVLGILGNFGIE